jgi:signal transduction histidine kinase
MRELDDLRLDRVLIRLLIAGSFAGSILGATGVTSDQHPAVAARLVGVVAGVVAVVGFVTGGGWWRSDILDTHPDRWRPWQLWAMSLGSAVAVVALPFGGLVWLPYLPVVTCARAFDLPRVVMYAAAPVLGIGYLAVHQEGPLATLSIDLLIALVAITLLQQRRRQVESAELAAAQQQVIAQERARAASAEQQREIATQLHDVLAHTLSGLMVSLQTAGLQASREGASPALQQRLSAATDLAKEGLHGARVAVESLHGAASTTAEQPLAEWLRHTVDRLRAGSDVQIDVTGDAAAIPEERWETARAVLREGMTNSVRHATDLPIRITLSDNEIRVLTVGDVAALPVTDQVSGGHGLAGLRRRVTADLGTFDAGATDDGWVVIARWDTNEETE